MKIPENLLYHPEHTWARVEGGLCVVGITDFAQQELGDVIFVELPDVGKMVKTGGVFGSVESAKSVSDLFSPLSGEVAEVNSALLDSPEMINDDPYGEGWVMKVKFTEPPSKGALLDSEGYAAALADK
ncbi:glycine cleavage system protein GcvH [bacterium]|nr:MAG: glycine cleavage system protein GcvH [bacterium]